MKTYLVIYTAALLVSLVLTSLAIWVGRKLELTDRTDVRKIHQKPVPRIGGLAVYLSVVSVVLPALFLRSATDDVSRQTLAKMHVLASAATIILLLGLADDIRALRARVKLSIQLVAAALVCGGGIRIESIAVAEWSPIDLQWFAWPVTMLWIVGVTNAVNLSDGVDGLAAVVSMIACGVIALLAFRSDQVLIGVLMLTMLGALTGFLWFNFHPARVFLGDSGSLFLGFVVSASSVLCFNKSRAFVVLALPAVALGIPILDTLLSILRRFVARRPIFAPDCGHLHHRLLELALRQRQVVGVIGVSTFLATCLGMLMLLVDARTSLVLFGGIFVFLLTPFYVGGVVRFRTVITGLKKRFHLSHQAREEIRDFCNLQLQFEQARSPRMWWQALCRTADQLDFAWALMSATDHEGSIETYMWRRPGTLPTSAQVTIVKVPVQTWARKRSIEVEVAALTNGSVEGAVRRASLIGRLIDEYRMPTSNGRACSSHAGTDGARVRSDRSLLTQTAKLARPDSMLDHSSCASSPSASDGSQRTVIEAGRAHADV